MTTIMTTVKASDRPIASDSSSFFARQAAAVAMAAETPQTDMSAQITMFSDRDGIRSTRCPNAIGGDQHDRRHDPRHADAGHAQHQAAG